ncbi:MAG: AmmeMemoRadiSam system protein B [Desulforhopalus sp.]|jgi:AmmeMemoRadiSam system protein B
MREPVVAGRFYPANKKELQSLIEGFTKKSKPKLPARAIAVIVPHAGYVYSGRLAATTLKTVHIPETVLLLGPNHTGHGHPASLSSEDWSTPLGPVPANHDLTNLIINESRHIVIDEAAHRFEHSLEVQLPFLQTLQQKLSIVPITLGRLSYTECEEIAESLYRATLTYPKEVLIVASTDMNHFESQSVSQAKDKLALDAIEALDPLALYTVVEKNKISMCGFVPVVITLLVSLKLDAKTATLLDYMDSGEVSGDTGKVVGYAGVIIQ